MTATRYYPNTCIFIENLDNFSLENKISNKSSFENDNTTSILFSEFININENFINKNILNFFPDLVKKTIEQEFERNLDMDLLEILKNEFNLTHIHDIIIPSSIKKIQEGSLSNGQIIVSENIQRYFIKI